MASIDACDDRTKLMEMRFHYDSVSKIVPMVPDFMLLWSACIYRIDSKITEAEPIVEGPEPVDVPMPFIHGDGGMDDRFVKAPPFIHGGGGMDDRLEKKPPPYIHGDGGTSNEPIVVFNMEPGANRVIVPTIENDFNKFQLRDKLAADERTLGRAWPSTPRPTSATAPVPQATPVRAPAHVVEV